MDDEMYERRVLGVRICELVVGRLEHVVDEDGRRYLLGRRLLRGRGQRGLRALLRRLLLEHVAKRTDAFDARGGQERLVARVSKNLGAVVLRVVHHEVPGGNRGDAETDAPTQALLQRGHHLGIEPRRLEEAERGEVRHRELCTQHVRRRARGRDLLREKDGRLEDARERGHGCGGLWRFAASS